MNIILIGFKSCGKSTIGRALAKNLQRSFADSDTLLEARHAKTKNENLCFREIYKKYGKLYFRELEQQVINQLGQLDNHIIATGGGTFISHPLSPNIQQNGKIVYLEVDPNMLLERIKAGGIPAYFKGPDLKQDFQEHFNQRVPIYKQLANYIINVSHCTPAQAAEQIKHNIGL